MNPLKSLAVWWGESEYNSAFCTLMKIPSNNLYKQKALTMRKNYLRLRERYSNDVNKKYNIVKDWSKYSRALHESSLTSDSRRLEGLNIVIEEIESRYKGLLGDEYIN